MRKARIENGVVVNVAKFDPESLPEWADDWIDVPGDVSAGDLFDGKAFTKPVLVVTSEQVNAERARRIVLGTDITLSDGTVIGMQGRPEDQINLTTQKDIAQYLIANGQPDTTVIWRDSHNTLHKLKPAQMIEVWLKSAAHVSAIYQASWDLKAMDPIPDLETYEGWPA